MKRTTFILIIVSVIAFIFQMGNIAHALRQIATEIDYANFSQSDIDRYKREVSFHTENADIVTAIEGIKRELRNIDSTIQFK